MSQKSMQHKTIKNNDCNILVYDYRKNEHDTLILSSSVLNIKI